MDWADWVLANEVILRSASFVGVFILMAILETLAPRRLSTLSRWKRWPANLGIVLMNTLLIRILFPAAVAGFALTVSQQRWGLFNQFDLPLLPTVMVSVLLLDLIIYAQHVLVHAVPVLWRIHRVHHADLDYDVSTGIRFHPLEILLSMFIKLAAVLLIGPPVIAVVIFEVLLNAGALFNHSNVHMPEIVDRMLRKLVVTPDMHRVHHSIERDETNSNFGFNLSCWDHLFGTYKAWPVAGNEMMTIGLPNLRNPEQVNRLSGMLTLPFSR